MGSKALFVLVVAHMVLTVSTNPTGALLQSQTLANLDATATKLTPTAKQYNDDVARALAAASEPTIPFDLGQGPPNQKHSKIECDLKTLQNTYPEPTSAPPDPFAPEPWDDEHVKAVITQMCPNVSSSAAESVYKFKDMMLNQIESERCRQAAVKDHCQRVHTRMLDQAAGKQAVFLDSDVIDTANHIPVQCDALHLEEQSNMRHHLRDITHCSIHGMVSEAGIVRYCSLEKSSRDITNTNGTRIAYAILAHRSAALVTRLVGAIYDPSNFYVIHADRARLSPDSVTRSLQRVLCSSKRKDPQTLKCSLPSNVRVISKVEVEWGTLSVFDALHAAVTELLAMNPSSSSSSSSSSSPSSEPWSHVINLSESDYPLQSQKVISKFLGAYGKGVSFIDIHDPAHALDDKRWRTREAHIHCEGKSQSVKLLKTPPSLRFFDGSMWTIMAREFWEEVVSEQNREIFKHVRAYAVDLVIPDEAMQQTLLMASSRCTRVCNANFRLENWNGGASPDVFLIEDMAGLSTSPAFFARKFDEGSYDVQNALDKVIQEREALGLTLEEWM